MTFSAVLALTDAVSTTQPWHGFTEAEILPAESEQRRDSRQMAEVAFLYSFATYWRPRSEWIING